MLTYDLSRLFLINGQPARCVMPRQNLTDVENAACHMPKHCNGEVWWIIVSWTRAFPYTRRGQKQPGLHFSCSTFGSLIRKGPRCKPNPNTFNRYYGGGFVEALRDWTPNRYPYREQIYWLFSDPSEAAYFKLYYG